MTMKIHMIIEMDCKQVSVTDNMAALVELMKIGSEKSMETISEFMKANQLMMTRKYYSFRSLIFEQVH